MFTECIRGDIYDGDNDDSIIHANKIALQILSHCMRLTSIENRNEMFKNETGEKMSLGVKK